VVVLIFRFCSGEQEAALGSANEKTLHVSASTLQHQFGSSTDVPALESGWFDLAFIEMT
jgi:hypothetical protein